MSTGSELPQPPAGYYWRAWQGKDSDDFRTVNLQLRRAGLRGWFSRHKYGTHVRTYGANGMASDIRARAHDLLRTYYADQELKQFVRDIDASA